MAGVEWLEDEMISLFIGIILCNQIYHKLAGCASLLHKVAPYQHENYTYRAASLIHWLVLKRDVAGLKERQEELGEARDLTCTRQDGSGHTTEVRDDSLVLLTITFKVLALSLALDVDGFVDGWEGQTEMVIMLLGN